MTSRRNLIKAAAVTAIAAGFPAIVPSSVFGQYAPSKRLNVGAVGTGRISRGHDMPGVWKDPRARIVAVCDVDSRRMEEGRQLVNAHYAETTGKPYDGVRIYGNYLDLLADPDIDAVIISTPDHWHAVQAIHAMRRGKDVYLQKPASLTIAEGRALSDTEQATGRILQIGSQQRSNMPQFRRAAELVRNGRIGDLQKVEIGLPGDPAGGDPTPMPVPQSLNYDAWLGPTPEVPYTVDRVHPQVGYDRPGWLRLRQFGSGMITGWGSHHIDSAHWGMNTEFTGPVEIWRDHVEYPASGLWDVHGRFRTEARYANGVHMSISGDYPNGIRYIGSKGWIFVSRGDSATTASDPKTAAVKKLDASDPRLLESVIGPDEIQLYKAEDQHGNWIDCVFSRQAPISPAEIGHRACTTCLLHDIAMVTGRRLTWDPLKERFIGDDAANALLSRQMRAPYTI